jgi:very-short-patch-repair endonuclease
MTKIADIAKASPSKSFRELNPSFFKATHSELVREEVPEASKPLISHPRKELPHPGSALASKFLNLWTQLGGPTLSYEFRFCPTRRWRADFCHEASKVIIEIEGAVYCRGKGHSSVGGILRDIEKYNEMTLLGYRLIRLHNLTITAPNVKRIMELIKV